MNILLTIAARGGSKGVKNKNIRTINNIPLIAITIGQAIKWGKAAKIIVTTDSEEIALTAKKYGAQVPFLRPPELATDTAGKIPALRHAVLESERIFSEKYDLLVDLDPTAPIRKISDLDSCLDLFLKNRPKSIVSVTKAKKNPYFNMVELNKSGFLKISKELDGSIIRRQDAPQVYSMNASIYFYSRDYILDQNTKSALSDKSMIYEMDDLSSVDIDREIDFNYIEYLIKHGVWSTNNE